MLNTGAKVAAASVEGMLKGLDSVQDVTKIIKLTGVSVTIGGTVIGWGLKAAKAVLTKVV